jgi:NodT family efflux transporter outer membrane factor (OMF) lipoprotein
MNRAWDALWLRNSYVGSCAMDGRTTPFGRTSPAPRWRMLLSLLVLLSGGCSHFKTYCKNGFKVGPNYGRPQVDVANDWIDKSKLLRRQANENAQWWLVFNDPILNELVLEGYAQNLTLRQAGARILEARAVQGIAIGGLFPQTQQANGSYTHTLRSNRAVTIPSATRNFSNWQTGLNMSWELDFWGRYRRLIEASSAELDASVESYDYVLVTLLADVGQAYVEIRSLQKRIELAEANVKALGGSRDIAKARFEAGATSEVDLLQAQTILSQTEALIPRLQADLRVSNNRLCILLGRPPEDLVIQMAAAPIPNPPLEVAVGIPADLIRRRPDVRQAERLLAAQCAQIGVAESDLYPHIAINGTIGVSSQQFNGMFKNGAGFGTVGPQLNWNILNYGRLLNNIRIQDARFQQLARAYEQQVLVANQQVEDAIIQYFKARERVVILTTAVGAAERSSVLVLNLYREGKADYNRVFNVLTFLVAQQDLLAQAAGDVGLFLVEINRALGGGWEIRTGIDGPTYCEGCDCLKLGCYDDYCKKPCPACPPCNGDPTFFDITAPAYPVKAPEEIGKGTPAK